MAYAKFTEGGFNVQNGFMGIKHYCTLNSISKLAIQTLTLHFQCPLHSAVPKPDLRKIWSLKKIPEGLTINISQYLKANITITSIQIQLFKCFTRQRFQIIKTTGRK